MDINFYSIQENLRLERERIEKKSWKHWNQFQTKDNKSKTFKFGLFKKKCTSH